MEEPLAKNICDICGRGFNRIEKLNVHKKVEHEALKNELLSSDDSDSDGDDISEMLAVNTDRRQTTVCEVQRSSKNHVDDTKPAVPMLEITKLRKALGRKLCEAEEILEDVPLVEPVCVVKEEMGTDSESMDSDETAASSDGDTEENVGKSAAGSLLRDRLSRNNRTPITNSAGTVTPDGEPPVGRVQIDRDDDAKERVGPLTTNRAEENCTEPGWLVSLKERTEKGRADQLNHGEKVSGGKSTEIKSEEPSWLVALKEKTAKEQRDKTDDTQTNSEVPVVNSLKSSPIEPACVIEVSDEALSIPVAERTVQPARSQPEPKPAPLPPVAPKDGTTYRRDSRLRKIIRPVKRLSYNDSYSDELDDSDDKKSCKNNAGASKAPKVKTSVSNNKPRTNIPVQKDIKCPMCPEVCHDLRGIKTHILEHLNDDTQICEVCQEEIPRRQDLLLHLRSHVKVTFKCQRCSAEFNKISSFYHHRDKHLVEEDGYVYTCNICGKSLYNKWYLKEHRRKHNKKTTYICEVCGKMFSTNATLKAHLEAHTSVKHICELCGKNYARRVGLLNHLRRDHEGIKKHECPDCGKKFFARKTLVQHTRIHTGEKPYACDFCGKTFSQKINRDQHRRLHTGEQPYRCEYCFKSFSLRAAYTQHLRTHTGFKVSEMNPSILPPPPQILSSEDNAEDVGNVTGQSPCDLSVHTKDCVE